MTFGSRNSAVLRTVSHAALALGWLSGAASAETYTASNFGQLSGSITAANGNSDASSTIVLTGSFVTSGVLAVPTKPITIDTQGFTLFGAPNSGVQFSAAGAVRTLVGTFQGSGGGTSGAALQLRNGASVTNMGMVQGGITASGGGGPGVDFGGPGAAVTLTNHGTIRGGAGTSGGAGILVRASTTGSNPIVNSGLIEGTNAAAIWTNSATISLNIVNSGTIRAGAGQNAIGWQTGVTPTTG